MDASLQKIADSANAVIEKSAGRLTDLVGSRKANYRNMDIV